MHTRQQVPSARGHDKPRSWRGMLAIGILSLSPGAMWAADAPDEAALVSQIKDLMRDTKPTGDQRADMEALAVRREKVLTLVEQVLKAYPKTRSYDEVMMAKLESMFLISVIRGKPLDDIEKEADRVLAANPPPELAAYAAYLKLRGTLARHGERTRVQSRTTQPQTATQRAAAQADLALQRRKFAVMHYLEYVSKYPKSQYAPRMLAAIVEDAWDRNDEATAAKYLAMLQEGFPHHVESKRVAAALKRRGAVGKPLDLSFASTTGEQIDIKKMKGHVVVVDFWATWCGPCRKALPELKALYERLQPRGLRVIGISLDSSRQALDDFVKKQDIPWPQYFDGKQWENEIARRFGIEAIPAVYVVDKNGILRAISPPSLDLLVDQLLNEPAK